MRNSTAQIAQWALVCLLAAGCATGGREETGGTGDTGQAHRTPTPTAPQSPRATGTPLPDIAAVAHGPALDGPDLTLALQHYHARDLVLQLLRIVPQSDLSELAPELLTPSMRRGYLLPPPKDRLDALLDATNLSERRRLIAVLDQQDQVNQEMLNRVSALASSVTVKDAYAWKQLLLQRLDEAAQSSRHVALLAHNADLRRAVLDDVPLWKRLRHKVAPLDFH